MAGEINHFYKGREILLVSILDGAIIFTADLCDYLKFPPNLTAYVFPVTEIPPPRNSSRMTASLKSDLSGKDVLLVDDILDTGKTMKMACRELALLGPSSIRTCVFLDKPERKIKWIFCRLGLAFPYPINLWSDGLDHAGRYRELPTLPRLNNQFDTSLQSCRKTQPSTPCLRLDALPRRKKTFGLMAWLNLFC